MFRDEVRRCVLTVMTWAVATRGAVHGIYTATTSALRRQYRQIRGRGGGGGAGGGFAGRRRRSGAAGGGNGTGGTSHGGSGEGGSGSEGDDDALQGFGLDRWEDAETHDPLNERLLPGLGLASREVGVARVQLTHKL
jgi:hypothetical protein